MRRGCLPALLLALALLLGGCADEYVSVTPHTEPEETPAAQNVVTAENYVSLRNAVLSFVEDSVSEGIIHIYDYSGDVEEDAQNAVYEVSREDPLGAYAVESMTHQCTWIVSYYEIRVQIEFRRTPEQIAAVERVASMSVLRERLAEAMEQGQESLTVRLSYDSGDDLVEMARACYRERPAEILEMPEITVSRYPQQGGYVRIVEILMTFEHTPEELQSRQEAVATSANAASEYVRYRETETGKLQLLYTYLLERFLYEPGTSSTPAYAFLCEGIASSEGAARSLQILCDEMELECYTVEGTLNGEPYVWNIVCVDGVYCHVDLYRTLLDGSESLPLLLDGAMTGYQWDTEAFPACV